MTAIVPALTLPIGAQWRGGVAGYGGGPVVWFFEAAPSAVRWQRWLNRVFKPPVRTQVPSCVDDCAFRFVGNLPGAWRASAVNRNHELLARTATIRAGSSDTHGRVQRFEVANDPERGDPEAGC